MSVQGYPVGVCFPAGGALDFEGVEVGGVRGVRGLEVGYAGEVGVSLDGGGGGAGVE